MPKNAASCLVYCSSIPECAAEIKRLTVGETGTDHKKRKNLALLSIFRLLYWVHKPSEPKRCPTSFIAWPTLNKDYVYMLRDGLGCFRFSWRQVCFAGCRLQVAGWNFIITGKPLTLKRNIQVLDLPWLIHEGVYDHSVRWLPNRPNGRRVYNFLWFLSLQWIIGFEKNI